MHAPCIKTLIINIIFTHPKRVGSIEKLMMCFKKRFLVLTGSEAKKQNQSISCHRLIIDITISISSPFFNTSEWHPMMGLIHIQLWQWGICDSITIWLTIKGHSCQNAWGEDLVDDQTIVLTIFPVLFLVWFKPFGFLQLEVALRQIFRCSTIIARSSTAVEYLFTQPAPRGWPSIGAKPILSRQSLNLIYIWKCYWEFYRKLVKNYFSCMISCCFLSTRVSTRRRHNLTETSLKMCWYCMTFCVPRKLLQNVFPCFENLKHSWKFFKRSDHTWLLHINVLKPAMNHLPSLYY